METSPSIPPPRARVPSGNCIFAEFSNHKLFVFDGHFFQMALSGWASMGGLAPMEEPLYMDRTPRCTRRTTPGYPPRLARLERPIAIESPA